MKKILFLILLTILLLGSTVSLVSCDAVMTDEEGDKPHIVTTVFPSYDWVRALLGNQADKADLTLLLDSGVDLHSYQGTAKDILQISSCDLLIYVGGPSDKWIDDVLQNAVNKSMTVIRLLDILGDDVHLHENDAHDHEHTDDDTHSIVQDEHVWLSLKHAARFCRAIETALFSLLPDCADEISINASAYMNELTTLDNAYRAAVDNAKQKTLLFADRFPFIYLTEDYDIPYYAAFSGCASAESEITPATRIFLAKKVDELGLSFILQTDTADGQIANAVRESATNGDTISILTLHSMQSITASDASRGATYLSIMQENLSILKRAFGEKASTAS